MNSPSRNEIPNGDDAFHAEKNHSDVKDSEKCDDEIDARPLETVKKIFKSSNKDKVTELAEQVVWGSKDSTEYDMRHPRRGVALIFNHVTFRKHKRRNGSEKDCEDLITQFAALGFDVRVHTDLEYKQMKGVLDTTSKEDHSDADCLAVVVMSHGDPGQIHAKDAPYRTEELWSRFTGERCVSLLGKPKLFFIQACRGDLVDDGVRVVATATDSSSVPTYTIPTQADMFISYATIDGHMSWRSPQNGSWYIQSLCEELSINGRTHDLLTIMTFVSRRVAVDHMSQVFDVPHLHMKVQMPAFTSMLTRLVVFREKSKKTTKMVRKTRIASDGTVVQTEEVDEVEEGDESERMSLDREEECTEQRMRTEESNDQSCPPLEKYVNEMREEHVWKREAVTRSEQPPRETTL